jgi:ATP-dependent RNA helicase RhlE
MPKEIIKLSDSILKNPRRVAVHTESSTTDTITQQVYHINRNFKRQLLQQISKKQNLPSILVFVNTIDESEKVFEFVKATNVKCGLLNKNKSQAGRQKALSDIKDGTIKVLVATDLASRGLDISDLSCVINYEIPNDAESYVHRIGRTARAGKDGLAIAFCTPPEKDKFKAIEKLIDQKIEIMEDESYKKVIIPQGKSDRLKKLNEKTKPRMQKGRKQYGKAANP